MTSFYTDDPPLCLVAGVTACPLADLDDYQPGDTAACPPGDLTVCHLVGHVCICLDCSDDNTLPPLQTDLSLPSGKNDQPLPETRGLGQLLTGPDGSCPLPATDRPSGGQS